MEKNILMTSFYKYAERRLLEDDDSTGVGPSLGNQGGGEVSDAKNAFHDLIPALTNGLSGPTGAQVLTSMINAIMKDGMVPQRVKQEINQKVQSRWSHLIDLSDSPPGEGPGVGNMPAGQPDSSMNNVIVPPMADRSG